MNLTEESEMGHCYHSKLWTPELEKAAKPRTYRLFKSSVKTESCSKNERSRLCQYRMGILTLRVVTGRYVGEAVQDRHVNW